MFSIKTSPSARKEPQYTDRASKQLAEAAMSQNRGPHGHKRMKMTEKQLKQKDQTKTSPQPAISSHKDHYSVVDIPPEEQNTVFAPFIKDYYGTASPLLKEYIHRSFLPWTQIVGIDRESVEKKLKALLDRTNQQGTIDSLYWTNMPLPQQVISKERFQGKTGFVFEDLILGSSSKEYDEAVKEEEREKLTGAIKWMEKQIVKTKAVIEKMEEGASGRK